MRASMVAKKSALFSAMLFIIGVVYLGIVSREKKSKGV